MLTGTIKNLDSLAPDDYRSYTSKFSDPNNLVKVNKLADDIKAIGQKQGATPGQVALAWVLAQGDNFFVIPGTKRVKVRV